MSSNSRLVLCIFLCLCTFLFTPAMAKTCMSMDIRNEVRSLEKLRNCTEIAGHLLICLIDVVRSEDEYDEYVFPELTQISGYLMFFSVSKLTSVGKLFPNLRVIRGMELFSDYALVLYDMPDITEIGTSNLLYIARGLVKVDKCPHLCYVDTVDWKTIGAQELHFTNVNNGTCDSCPRNCPDNCWNTKQCQLMHTEHCHIECLGCYRNGSAEHCYECKNYEDNGTCVEICPSNKFIHAFTNKCVTELECQKWNGTWWSFKNECIDQCPPFYEQYVQPNGKLSCRACGQYCTRYCKGAVIESLIRLQGFKGCTHINGSISIRMNEEYVEKLERELTVALQSVRYISGTLVIRRTKAIRSLMFLKNLREIGGESKLENGKYALFVVQNQNLQTVFNISNPEFSLKIRKGKIAFHDNPLLCLSEIERFAAATDLKDKYTEVDVSAYSNGEKAPCVVLNMSMSAKANSTNATLTWVSTAAKTTLGYTVYYKPHVGSRASGNDSMKDSMEVCVSNPWKSIFTWNNTVVLTKLRPFTRYAYYIKVYDRKASGSQSQMMFFTTLSDDPDPPAYVIATAVDYDTILLEWNRPRLTNGILAHYRLDYNEVPDRPVLRDYCLYPRSPEGDKIDDDEDEERPPTTIAPPLSDEENCTCSIAPTKSPKKHVYFSDWTIRMLDDRLDLCDVNAQSKFKKNNCGKVEYNVDQNAAEYQVAKRRSNDPEDMVKSFENYYNDTYTELIPASTTSFNLTGLKHFTMYAFYFSACNHPINLRKCSSIMFTFKRTKKKDDADDIEDLKYTQEGQDVTVTWSEPQDPNSAIVAYRVIYEYVNANNMLMNSSHCLPRNRAFNDSRLALRSLQPGRYLLRVQSESLAGLGKFSEPIVFDIILPQSAAQGIIVIAVPLLVIIAAGLGALYFYLWYKRKNRLDNIHLITSVNPDYDGAIYVEDEWEIDRLDVEIQQNLGHGTFGVVHFGNIKSRKLPCAIKTVNENATISEQMQFLYEASVMKSFSNCHHVVRLIGVVSKGQPPLVIMELMERGDLKKYLRNTRDSSHSLTMNEIYRMAAEIADGMAYLAAKKFVHRDLAARNCMVASDRTVKIGDFGMARDIYETDYYKKETKGLLPVRWMAPESLADGVFTSDSDVWSYGIVLWEIATLAEQPYQGLSNEQVLQFVVSKGRLTRPQECSDLLYDIMRKCWSWRPNDRPTFWDIVERLEMENHIGQDFKPVSFIHSREGEEHRIKHGHQRTVNQPAMSVEPQEDLYSHYRAAEEEVTLHVGSVPRRSAPGYLFRASPIISGNEEHDRFLPDDQFY